jgi:aminobenzoyl-glutamate utilization protein B
MVDQVFSYGELGFQEVETSKYLVGILKKNGFTVEEGVAGIPTAFMATWGSGKPVIAMGSDIDGIPQSSQKPGVAYRDPLVAGAPGHGEGHNSGQAVNITAAIVLKKLMEREKIPGTIRIWPGVAEELVGTKAFYVARASLRMWMSRSSRTWAAISACRGAAAAARVSCPCSTASRAKARTLPGAPWRGRSALDAVELMDVGWNFRREHLPLSSRSHYVIPDGGDQPNVVPPTASVWYYFRQVTYPGIKEMWAAGDQVAQGAAQMANVKLLPTRVLGSAWPQHFNRAVAEVTWANIQKVGMPEWSEDDQAFARAVQKELGVTESGLSTRLGGLGGPVDPNTNTGGGSDDIGDVSWNVPTVTLRYPSNIPGLPGHNWADGMAMATPIAHKGVTAGAKVQAMTLVDLMMKPEVVAAAWDYFNNTQTRTQKYEPLIRPQDQAAIEWNQDIMAKYRDKMRPYYFDPTKYKTYLEQLGIKYPVIKK